MRFASSAGDVLSSFVVVYRNRGSESPGGCCLRKEYLEFRKSEGEEPSQTPKFPPPRAPRPPWLGPVGALARKTPSVLPRTGEISPCASLAALSWCAGAAGESFGGNPVFREKLLQMYLNGVHLAAGTEFDVTGLPLTGGVNLLLCRVGGQAHMPKISIKRTKNMPLDLGFGLSAALLKPITMEGVTYHASCNDFYSSYASFTREHFWPPLSVSIPALRCIWLSRRKFRCARFGSLPSSSITRVRI